MSQHENSPCFSVITIEKLEVMGLVSRDGGRAQHCHLAAQHNQGHLSPGVSCLLCYSFHILIHHVSAHWSYQKFQIFKAVLSIFSIYVGIYNGLWPEKVQHLPHADTGPFPVLGISVLCWSNSDSNFKMFSAAIS